MTDLAGPVALALVVLWVAYLVPHKLRHRQQLLESRAEDRYSDGLRVVAIRSWVAVGRSTVVPPVSSTGRRTGTPLPGVSNPVVLRAAARGVGTGADRPGRSVTATTRSPSE